MEKTCDKLERERDEARTELEMWRDGNIMHEFHRDELQKAERERNEAIQERERWKMQAMQKWGMRRELEELLQVGDTECEEQFAKGLAALRDLIQERDEARKDVRKLQDIKRKHEHDELAAAQEADRLKQERDEARAELEMWRDGNILHENHRDELEKAERERDEARAAAISRRYTCHECGRKGRHSKQNRGAQPICPPCDFSRLFGSGRPEDWEG
jgi:DNA-directed RNA polymerase subunit RPC12/RpoP